MGAEKRVLVLTRGIARMSSSRYVIYLPIKLNDLWEKLRSMGKSVRVYIEWEEGGHLGVNSDGGGERYAEG